MKDKLLDLGLLMALVIVALLVGITLYGPSFNLKGFSRGNKPIIQTNPRNNLNSTNDSNTTADTATNTSSNPDTSNSDSTGTTVQVVNPNNPNTTTTANTDTPVSENSTANTAANTNTEIVTVAAATQSETTNQGSSPNNSNSTEVVTVAAALPEGSFDLQSIGFSYVTGGSGACGITLEAWKHVAVSRDILAKYPCGSKITINIDKPIAGHSSFTAIVGDTMNSKHSKTVNIYVGRDEPALEYGRQEGNLVP